MKLLAKYNRVNIPITIGTLLISSVAYYFILHLVLIHQLDKDLLIEKQEILNHVKEKGALPEASNYKDQQIKFTAIPYGNSKEKFLTDIVHEKNDDEQETFRRLDFPITVNDIQYTATVTKSQEETEDIVRLILWITFAVIAFLLSVLFVANRFLLGKLWQPFYNTLEQLKDFNLSSKNGIHLQKTDIEEFRQLNKTAIMMTEKVSNDYEALKNFTENASHEIQTPLAIIKTKLELLSQSETSGEKQIHIIESLNEAASRLSKLNQSLLLLTKIENRQFEMSNIDLSSILSRYLENFEELAEAKHIIVIKNIRENESVEMNESLGGILISNLMSNAIRHNHINGKIEIKLYDGVLKISNTGTAPVNDTSVFFERFRKASSSNDSLGLGLSIVKKICELYDFQIKYAYHELHEVTIQFKEDKKENS